MATQVVGYDGTDGARAALDAAVALAAELNDSLVVVFAHQVSRLGGEVHDYEEALLERGRAVLEDARGIAREAGVDPELVIREQSSADALIEVADEHDARMIVVGSYGERPIKSALVGSTPTRLLHLSERPVLVVRASE
jgi:nucleotide-binding universal stress UspA family protein